MSTGNEQVSSPTKQPSDEQERQHLIVLNVKLVADEQAAADARMQAAAIADLDKVLSEDMVFRRANGTLEDKASFLKAAPSSKVRDRRVLGDVVAAVLGDTAVVTLTVSARVPDDKEVFSERTFKNIRFFARANGLWLLRCWYNEAIQ